MNDFVKLLNGYNVQLSKEEIDSIISCGTVMKLKKNEIFLDYGDSATKIAFVKSGILEMLMDVNDTEKIIDFICPHAIALDYLGFLLAKPSELQIKASTDSVILFFKKETLSQILNTKPTYRKIERLLTEKSHSELIQKIRWMYLPPKERYEIFMKKYPDIGQQIPQYKIASFLNVTPEWLSKIRASK